MINPNPAEKSAILSQTTPRMLHHPEYNNPAGCLKSDCQMIGKAFVRQHEATNKTANGHHTPENHKQIPNQLLNMNLSICVPFL